MLDQADLDLESALLKEVHRAYLETAAGTPQRMIARAERAAALSAGLSTSYLALAALKPPVFVSGHAWTALLPALWFGVSIVFYGIFITASGDKEYEARPLTMATTETNRTNRLRSFVSWVNRTALRRRWALQIGTASMASGVVAMPLPLLLPTLPLLHLLGLLPPLIAVVGLVLGARQAPTPSSTEATALPR